MLDSFARRARSEEGIALVFTLLATLIVGGLIVLILSRTVNQQRLSANSRDFEVSVHVAEAALDDVVLRVNADRNYVSTDTVGAFEYTLGANATNDAQRVWALAAANRFVANSPATARIRSGTSGEAVAIRPVDGGTNALNVIFSVVYMPDADNPREVRVLRLSFDQNQFTPSRAVLTEGDLDLSGSNPNGGGVVGALGNVHANGNINVGGARVDGDVSATGTITGNTANVAGGLFPGVSREFVPNISAREMWDLSPQFIPCYADNTKCATGAAGKILWWDLCPDGTARQADGLDPCKGTIVNASTPGVFRTWSYGSGTWQSNGGNPDGVFYVWCADARVNGGKGFATVIVEDPIDSPVDTGQPNCANRTNPNLVGNIRQLGGSCLKSGTNDLLFVVDNDLNIQGGGGSGDCLGGFSFEGLMAAGEQVELKSSSASMRGGVIARDQGTGCATAPSCSSLVDKNNISNKFRVTYESTITVPFSALVRTTAWVEL